MAAPLSGRSPLAEGTSVSGAILACATVGTVTVHQRHTVTLSSENLGAAVTSPPSVPNSWRPSRSAPPFWVRQRCGIIPQNRVIAAFEPVRSALLQTQPTGLTQIIIHRMVSHIPHNSPVECEEEVLSFLHSASLLSQAAVNANVHQFTRAADVLYLLQHSCEQQCSRDFVPSSGGLGYVISTQCELRVLYLTH